MAITDFATRTISSAIYSSVSPVVMGNKPAKPRKDEVLVRIVPPVDRAYMRWLARDLERLYGFPPGNPRAIKPPDHCVEFMRHQGWLDLNLDDPDLAHLFK